MCLFFLILCMLEVSRLYNCYIIVVVYYIGYIYICACPKYEIRCNVFGWFSLFFMSVHTRKIYYSYLTPSFITFIE